MTVASSPPVPKRRGRPPNPDGPSVIVPLRFSPRVLEAYAADAAARGVTLSVVLRDVLERHQPRGGQTRT